MPRTPLVAASLLLVLAACGDPPRPAAPTPQEVEVDFGASPAPLVLEGAPASVQPPAGSWLTLTDRPGPDRATEQFRREADGVLLQAAVFPVQASPLPLPTLPRVVDGFVRGQGTDGFGQGPRQHGLLQGARAAWMTFTYVAQGRTWRGHARLLLADPGHFAFAVGAAPSDAPPAATAVVAAFVESLRPTRATFYARRFRDPTSLDAPIAREEGEEPVTRRDLVAVQLVVEVGTGTRFPLAVQPAMLDALAAEALAGTPASRAAFRDVARTLAETHGMPPARREAGMAALGTRILEQIFNRATEGYAPANRYRLAWKAMGRPAVGEGDAALSVAAVQSLHEMSAFLASLAADREVPTAEAHYQTLVADLQARFGALAEGDRAALAQSGTTWARLRYAWDHADDGGRLALRRAALETLVAPAQQAEVQALPDEAALVAWMEAHADAGPAYLRRAAALPPATRAALVERLGVEDPGPRVGW